jgi:transcription elongation factor Elf1
MKTSEKASCPVCLSLSGAYYLNVREFKIFKCQCCGLEHTYPIPSAVQLINFYSTCTDVRAASDVVRLNARRNLSLLKDFGYNRRKTILDFGAGDGDFVEIAGEKCYGIDFKK